MDASAIQIGVWMVSGGSVLVIANQVLKLADRLKEKPPVSEVYETKEHCRTLENATVHRLGKLEEAQTEIFRKLESMSAADEQGRSKIHERINKLSELIAKVLGRLEK